MHGPHGPTAPGGVADEATPVVAQRCRVVVVVAHVVAAVLVLVGAGVTAFAGVDADRRAAVQPVMAEGVGGPASSDSVQPSRFTARQVVLVMSTHSLFSDRFERFSRPGESYRTALMYTRDDRGPGDGRRPTPATPPPPRKRQPRQR